MFCFVFGENKIRICVCFRLQYIGTETVSSGCRDGHNDVLIESCI